MYTLKDIEFRTIFVINCFHERSVRVCNGELLLEEHVDDSDKTKTLTKLPFQKILALFIIGNIRITTPLIEKCKKFGVAIVVMKMSLRPVFYWADFAEANFILHKRQYDFSKENISIAKIIVANKLQNQLKTLHDTRRKDSLTENSCHALADCIEKAASAESYDSLLGIEGNGAKSFFAALFQDFNWHQRRPRTKCDVLNTSLDIGYAMLFNYVECFLRMFGFDLYVGVYHRLWFKRKSLVCDIMESFRPIIDKAVRTAWNRKQFSINDFQVMKGEYRLKHERNSVYCRVFFDALIPYKKDVFVYVQRYYRCFMNCSSVKSYPLFKL